MREQVVDDEVQYAVDRDPETDRKGYGFAQRMFGEHQQENRRDTKSGREKVVHLERSFSWDVMRPMDPPQHAVEEPSVDDIGEGLHACESENCERDELHHSAVRGQGNWFRHWKKSPTLTPGP